MKAKVLALGLVLFNLLPASFNPVSAGQNTTQGLEEQYKQAITAAEASKNYSAEVKLDMNLASLYVKAGAYEKAKTTMNQALGIAKQYLPARSPLTGLLVVQLGAMQLFDQNFDKALAMMSEGIAILGQYPQYQSVVQNFKSLEGMLRNYQIGLAAMKDQDYALAEQNFQKILAVSQQLNEAHLLSASLSTIGVAQVLQDKAREAEQSLQKALQYAESTGMTEAKTLALLGYEELYVRQGNIEQAKKCFELAVLDGQALFAQMKISKPCIDQERQRLALIEQAIDAAKVPVSASDYFSDALFHQKVLHWNTETPAIRIYIAPGNQIAGWKSEYIDNFKKACLVWQQALNNQIQFQFVDNPSDADTIVTWTGEYKSRIGLTVYNFALNKLSKADIQINLGTFDQHLYDPRVVYKVSLHELGHLLGIMGHSKNPKDIMFPSITLTSQLSERDVKTIRNLYAAAPDISNPVGMSIVQYRNLLTQTPKNTVIESIDHF